jgi:hypothetical protein
MCHTTRRNYPQCSSLLQTTSLDKNGTYNFQSCGDICPQLDIYKEKIRRLDVGFSPYKRWFNCPRVRLLVDKKTKKTFPARHMRRPLLIIIPKVRQIALSTTATYQLGQTSQKHREKRQEWESSYKHVLRYRMGKCIFFRRHTHNISFRNYSQRLRF